MLLRYIRCYHTCLEGIDRTIRREEKICFRIENNIHPGFHIRLKT